MKRSAILVLATLLFGSTAWAQTCNHAGRTIALLMDASGSMNARLPNGETRIAVAKRAIKGVAALMPAEARFACGSTARSRRRAEKIAKTRNLVVPSGPAGRPAARHRGRRRCREGPRLHADRLFAGTSGERFPGRCQGARHRAGQRRQGNLPGRSGAGRPGARRQGHHRSHDRIRRRHGGARATAGHRAHDRRHLFRRAGRTGIAGHAQKALNACAQRVVTLPPKPKPGKLRTTSATYTHDIINSETGQKVD